MRERGRDDVSALVRAARRALGAARRATGGELGGERSGGDLPSLGLSGEELRGICRAVFARHELSSCDEWRRAVLALWRGARCAEERVAAFELSGRRGYECCQTAGALALYEEMIASSPPGRLGDAVARRRVAPILREAPAPVGRVLRRWARSADPRMRRAALLSQVGVGAPADPRLLADCLSRLRDDPAPIVRRAVAAALRRGARGRAGGAAPASVRVGDAARGARRSRPVRG